jgi:hypothetical protein
LLLDFKAGRLKGGSKAVVVEGNSQSFSEKLNENSLERRREIRVGVGERFKAYDECTKNWF